MYCPDDSFLGTGQDLPRSEESSAERTNQSYEHMKTKLISLKDLQQDMTIVAEKLNQRSLNSLEQPRRTPYLDR